MIEVEIVINPCRVFYLWQGNTQNFTDYDILTGTVQPVLFDFNEFQQYPECNYTLSYSLTVVEKNG